MKWEYKIVPLEVSGIRIPKSAEKGAAELNALGSEGWEAVTVWADTLFSLVLMKRPLPK